LTPRVVFPNKVLPYLLVAPQLADRTLVFFYWPAGQALYQSMLREDPFGLKTQFVWFANFEKVLADPNYINSLQVTVVFSCRRPSCRWSWRCCWPSWPTKSCEAKGFYRTLLIWPYAVAPAIAGMLWLFLFNPSIGSLAYGCARWALPGTRC
jgi:sn-glycerol 3-phosphate transport system permease protein